jgi:hypothetical protein
MGLFKKFKEALPAVAGVAGFAIGGPTGAAIGSGLGSLAAGKSVNDALVNAAMGYGVGSMGQAAGFRPAPSTASGFSQFLPGRATQAAGETGLSVAKNFGIGNADVVPMSSMVKESALGSLFDSDMLKYGALGAGALALAGGLGTEEETSSGSFYDDSYEGQARGKVVGPTSNKEYNINSPADMDKYNQEILDLQKYEKRTRAASREYDPIRGYAAGGEHIGGGEVDGPGTGTSDSVPARLSDGEFVLTAKAVRGAGGGDRDIGAARIYDMMADLEATA